MTVYYGLKVIAVPFVLYFLRALCLTSEMKIWIKSCCNFFDCRRLRFQYIFSYRTYVYVTTNMKLKTGRKLYML